MARPLRLSIISVAGVVEVIRIASLFCQVTPFMEPPLAVTAGLCLPSAWMERGLQHSTVSAAVLMGVVHPADWFYPATPCMERRLVAAPRPMEQFLPSTPTGQVLRPFI